MPDHSVMGRFATKAGDLGLSAPPVPVRVRVERGSTEGALRVQAASPCSLAKIAEWLEPFAPVRIEVLGRFHYRADFRPLPDAWVRPYRNARLSYIDLGPGERATVCVAGTRAALATFASTLSQRARVVRVQRTGTRAGPAGLLTPAQKEAIQAAVSAGYYDIPRPLNLHQLAAQLGLASASLSERLRRAEGRIIRRYAQSMDDPVWWEEGPSLPPRSETG